MDPTEDAEPRWPAWRATLLLLLLTGGYALSVIDRRIIAFVADDLRRALAISDAALGLLQGFAFSLFYAAAAVPLGRVIDLKPRPFAIGIAIGVWSMATMACGLSRSFAALALARMGVGAGEAALSPGAYSMIPDMFAAKRVPAAMAVYSVGAILAGGGAGLLAASVYAAADVQGLVTVPLLGAIDAWRAVFLLAGAPGIFFAAVFLCLPDPAGRRLAAPVRTARNAPATSAWCFITENWRSHVVFAASMALTTTVLYAVLGWDAVVLARVFAWDAARVGETVGYASLVSGILGCLLTGALTSGLVKRRHSRGLLAMVATGICLLFVGGVALPFLRTGWSFVIVNAMICLTAVGLTILGPLILQMITPAQLRGRASALFLFVNVGLGAGLGPALVGLLTTFVFVMGARCCWRSDSSSQPVRWGLLLCWDGPREASIAAYRMQRGDPGERRSYA